MERRIARLFGNFMKLPYRIVEAGRQWLCVVENWIMYEYGMELVSGVDQLFFKRCADGSIGLLISKVLDEFFVDG